jgi:N-acetylglutamate synthase-like GNAT family acetyltransferase
MPDVVADVAPVADELGLRAAGACTLMACDLDLSYAEAPSQRVERALDADALDEVGELVAAAFGLDGSGIIGRELYDAQGADAWLLRNEEGHAVSAVVATADPDLVGLWSVATPPAAQRRGHGAHLLRAVLGHYALEGVTTACVLATEAGEQLYRTLGFKAAERLHVWMKRS